MRHLRRTIESPKLQRRVERWALNVGAAVGAVCLVFAAVSLIFGLKPLIFISGSMSPSIPVGSLAVAVAQPVSQVEPGQVVSVVNSAGTRITHRVVSVSPAGLVLKGDANKVADLEPYRVSNADRVLFSVPYLGTFIAALSAPWAFFLGGLFCAGLVYMAFFRKGNEPENDSRNDAESQPLLRPRGKRRSRLLRNTGAFMAVTMLGASLGLVAQVQPTLAAFTGTAAAQTSTLRSPVPGPITNLSCASVDKTTVKLAWNSPSDRPTTYIFTAIETTQTGGTVAGATAATMTLDGSLTSYNATNSANGSGGLLGDLVGLLFGYTKYLRITITAYYGTEWSGQSVIYSGVKATAGLLGANPALSCQ